MTRPVYLVGIVDNLAGVLDVGGVLPLALDPHPPILNIIERSITIFIPGVLRLKLNIILIFSVFHSQHNILV